MSDSDYTFSDALCLTAPEPTPVRPMPGDRIRIQWQDLGGWPLDYDSVTVVDPPYVTAPHFVMFVRVGWIGSTPQVMVFPSVVREFDDFGRPVIREWHGVPWNYQA